MVIPTSSVLPEPHSILLGPHAVDDERTLQHLYVCTNSCLNICFSGDAVEVDSSERGAGSGAFCLLGETRAGSGAVCLMFAAAQICAIGGGIILPSMGS